MKTKENGVTLVVLVVTIVLLLIIASIGVAVGTTTLDTAAFTRFKTELRVMQDKVNELNQENKIDIEQELTPKLTDEQKNIFNKTEIKEIIFKGKTGEQQENIKDGFRYLSKDYINTKLNLDSFKRSYFVNVEYRYVIFPDGFEYDGITYYMIDQIEEEIYNVQYKDKNEKSGSFEVTTTKENNKYKIEISNIQYNGYVDKWQVKYKLEDDSYWKTSDNLTFYIKEYGKYSIKVVHGDEIDLGTKTVFAFNYANGVNSPEVLTGMTPIKFTDPTDTEEGTTVKTTVSDSNWYNYDTQKWANAQTQDGSMWVWIPRYAYRINSSSQTCDIVFLIGTTDNYYDENGNIQTAKRQKTADETIDTTTGYTVHPAFTNEANIKYANGGWKKELLGIWVSKFEAGYATGNNTVTKANGTAYTKDEIISKGSSVKYTQTNAFVASAETGTGSDGISARNWLDGIYGSTETTIKYPTFQGLTYSMNYINHNDAYNISKALTESGNIYGLNSSNADSHLMKNSEWGAVAYLSQSKYGLNGSNIYVNNVNLWNSTQSVYAVTGCSAKTTADDDAVTTTIEEINNRTANVYTWTQKNGQKASSTGTIYGIYDMSGGTWERTAGIVANGNSELTDWGKSLIDAVTKTNEDDTAIYESTPYVTVYPSNDSGVTDIDTASTNNYAVNTKIYGDAIRETSTAGVGQSSWYNDYSYFVGSGGPFYGRGGHLWDRTNAGLFAFDRFSGNSSYYSGFRAVLVAQ